MIGLGIVNLIHASLHIIQFIQSMFLLTVSVQKHENETGLDKIMHNPIFAFIWAGIGFITIYIGIKDFIHHKKHKHENET